MGHLFLCKADQIRQFDCIDGTDFLADSAVDAVFRMGERGFCAAPTERMGWTAGDTLTAPNALRG
jgi:hypothetical protein